MNPSCRLGPLSLPIRLPFLPPLSESHAEYAAWRSFFSRRRPTQRHAFPFLPLMQSSPRLIVSALYPYT